MTIHRLTRRTVLEGAAALGAIGCLPARLAAQPARAEPLPGRGDIVIRGATVLTMDERLGVQFVPAGEVVRDTKRFAPLSPPSLPGLTRQSIFFAKCLLRRRWTRGSSPRVTPANELAAR